MVMSSLEAGKQSNMRVTREDGWKTWAGSQLGEHLRWGQSTDTRPVCPNGVGSEWAVVGLPCHWRRIWVRDRGRKAGQNGL